MPYMLTQCAFSFRSISAIFDLSIWLGFGDEDYQFFRRPGASPGCFETNKAVEILYHNFHEGLLAGIPALAMAVVFASPSQQLACCQNISRIDLVCQWAVSLGLLLLGWACPRFLVGICVTCVIAKDAVFFPN